MRNISILAMLGAMLLVSSAGCGKKIAAPATKAPPKSVAKSQPRAKPLPLPADSVPEVPTKAPPLASEKSPSPKPNTPASNAPPTTPASGNAPPKAFSGKDQESSSPIPPEIQQELSSYRGNEEKKIELLLTYPHPQVRVQAAERLNSTEDAKKEKVVQALRGALQDPNSEVRFAAALTLSYHLPQAKAAVAELAALVVDPSEGTAAKALYTLQKLGPDAAPALPQLLAALGKEKEPNRGDVMRALGEIGPAAKEAIPGLVKQLDSFSWGEESAKALGQIGAEQILLNMLGHESDSVRSHAAQGCGYLPKPGAAVPARLIKMAIGDSYDYGRGHAAEALGKIRPTTKEIVAALMKAAADESDAVRRMALTALGICEPKFDEAIPVLVKASSDKENWVRESATEALGKYQGSPEVRLQVIVNQIVSDGEMYYSAKAAALKAGGEEFYPLLKKMAENAMIDEVRRSIALGALQFITGQSEVKNDPRETEVKEIAESWLDEGNPATMRSAAASTLRKLNAPRSQAGKAAWMAGIRGAKFREVRLDAMDALAGSPENKDAIPLLIEALDDGDPRVVAAAARNAARFGKDASGAVPHLVKLAVKPDLKEQRRELIGSLGDIASDPKVSVPYLTKLLDDKDVSTLAANALAKVIAQNDLDAKEFLTRLPPLISKAESYTQSSYLTSLGILGPKAAPAVPLVRSFLTRKEDYEKHQAAETLGKIGPAAKEAAAELAAAAGVWERPEPAVMALGQIKHGGKEFAAVAPELLDNIDLRYAVLTTLGELGPDAKDALPAVVKILESKTPYDRRLALETLAKWGDAAKGALARVKEVASSDEDEDIRKMAGKTLLGLAPDDPEVLEATLADAENLQPDEAKEFLEPLGKVAPQVVAQGLKSERANIRRAALNIAPVALPTEQLKAAYQAALADMDPGVRGVAARRLSLAGDSSPELLRALLEGIENDQTGETQRALYGAGREAVPALAALILDEKRPFKTRQAAVRTLRQIETSPHQVGAALGPALKSQEPDTQYLAAVALSSNARLKSEVIPILLENVKSKDEERRIEAIRACGSLHWDEEDIPHDLVAALLDIGAGENEELAEESLRSISYKTFSSREVPAILKLLEKETTLPGAAELLSCARGCRDDRFVPALVDALKKADDEDGQTLTLALNRQGEPGRQALLAIVTDGEATLASRKAAVTGLMRTPKPAPEVIEKVASLLADKKLAPTAAALLAGWNYDWQPLQLHLLSAMNDTNGLQYRLPEIFEARGADAAGMVADLAKLATGGEESRASYPAIAALGAIGPHSPEARKTLLTLLRQEQEKYQVDNLARALARGGEDAVKEVVGATADAKGGELARLLRALRVMDTSAGDQPAVVAAIAPHLKSSDIQVKREAAVALAYLKSGGEGTVPTLLEMLADEKRDVKSESLYALGNLGPKAKAAVPRLIELLGDRELNDSAIDVLGRIGPAAAPSVPNLIALLDDPEVGESAAAALGEMGPAAKEVVPALLAQFESERKVFSAAGALAKIQPEEVLPALYKQLKDPNRRYAALQAIGELERKDAEPAIPVLLKALEREDIELRLASLNTLGRLGEVASQAVEKLVPHLASDDEEVRRSTAHALGSIKSRPEVCVPALLPLLDDKDESLRSAAAYALGAHKAAEAVPALRKWLADEKRQAVAARVLGQIGPAAKEAVPELTKVALTEPAIIDDENGFARSNAIEALAAIGPDAAAAVPELVKLLPTTSGSLRSRVGEALWKIDPTAAEKSGAPRLPQRGSMGR